MKLELGKVAAARTHFSVDLASLSLRVTVFRTQQRTNPGPDHRQGREPRDPLRGGGVDPVCGSVHTAAARKQGRLAGSPPQAHRQAVPVYTALIPPREMFYKRAPP